MIGFVILTLIGLYSFGAVLFGSNFSEIHLTFSFLNFPVFISEILMGICLILGVSQYWRKDIVLTKWHKIFLIYWGGIILKAVWDFWTWGPLAFRNAALFYYPIFAFLGYCFYKKGYITQRYIYILLILLAFLSSRYIFDVSRGFLNTGYFRYTAFALATILLMHVRDMRWKVLFIGMFLIFGKYAALFGESRTNLMGTLIAFTFLGIVFIRYFLTCNRRVKITIGCGVIAIVIANTAYFADKNGVQSCLRIRGLYGQYASAVSYVEQTRAYYKQVEMPVALYHDNEVKGEHPPRQGFVGKGYNGIVRVPATISDSGRQYRALSDAQTNGVFRILIWRDMLKELMEKKSFLGVGLGKPQRSPSLEILWWGSGEWGRDGWITPHNSFFHMIYRLGIVGVLVIIGMIGTVCHLIKVFIRVRSKEGVILVSALIYWLMISNFLVILELPHYAIPFWTLFGMTLAYGNEILGRYKNYT